MGNIRESRIETDRKRKKKEAAARPRRASARLTVGTRAHVMVTIAQPRIPNNNNTVIKSLGKEVAFRRGSH